MKESQTFIRKLKSEKRLTNFELVKSIIAAMNSTELKFAKNYLMLLHTAEFESQPLKLFRYIQQNPEISESQARLRFNDEQHSNFDKTVTTLKKRLGWTLVSEFNTQREDAYSQKWKVTFEVMSNLMLYPVVLSRGIPGFAFDLLNETIEKAKQVEAYRELKTALELKIRHIRARSENREITRLEKELGFYTFCEKALNDAKAIYDDLGASNRKLGVDEQTTIKNFEKGLAQLDKLHDITGSQSILYYCLFIQANLFQLKKDYRAAGKTLLKLANLVQHSPVLNSKPNLGRSSLDLANNYLLQGEYEIALPLCKKAKTCFLEHSHNYFQVEFQEFYAYFYTNQFYLAEKKMRGILDNPSYRESEFLVNTKKYLLGCTCFAQEKYAEALALFLGLEKIWGDTTGWNVGLRMMIMLCYKMMSNYELMAIERDRFRGLFDKYRHRSQIRSRDKMILKIIHEFLKQNSDFKSVYERKSDLFTQLARPEHRWQPMTHEMIVFEQWFSCMMRKTKYRLED